MSIPTEHKHRSRATALWTGASILIAIVASGGCVSAATPADPPSTTTGSSAETESAGVPSLAGSDGTGTDPAAETTSTPTSSGDQGSTGPEPSADESTSTGPVEAVECPPPPMTRPTRTNIEYGSEHARQRFDLYPVEDDAAPLIIWIHGGGFRQGSKDNIPPQILAFQERGFAIASIEYRLSNVPWPATLTDPKRALLWIRRHADELGVDPDRIAVSGESAGGCLAALLGASAGAEGLRDDPSLADEDRPVSLAISLFGPTQFEVMNEDGLAAGCTPGFDHLAPDSPENELLDCPSGDLRDCPDRLTFSNPVAYVDAEDPPFVFLHGGADCTVAAGQSERMHHALTEAGVSSVLHVVPGAAHRVDPILANSDAAQSLEDALFVHVAGCTPPDNGPGGGG